MNSRLFCVLAFLLLHLNAVSGQTIGLTQLDEESLEGYTFFSPFSSTKAFLVDQCGRLVNEWDRGTRPGLAAYFLDNGLMLRTYKADPMGPFTSASNAGGLALVDWDNNTLWSYEFNTPTFLSHHDAVYMPNGHILVLSWELAYTDELIALGRDPNEIAPQGFMWSEKILEIEPVFPNDINIVWEWQIKDHYIQDFDPSKANYGEIAMHPERFDINLPELNSSNSNSSRDWNHFNAIDYNEALDQILISVRNSDEIWIIDHSTTTEEAATSSGGLYGKGGDILYRWGNPSAYQRGQVSDQQLFGQHGAHWIRDGLEDAGKILIYNNGNGRPGPDFSTAEILVPVQDENGGYPVPATAPFGPEAPAWKYGHLFGENFYSAYLSNAQRLPNGNTLINAGSVGTIFEITPEREVVWEYVIPLSGDFPMTQGQNPGNNSSFRAYKFAADYPGFEGIELESGDYIENGGNPIECMLVSALPQLHHSMEVRYLPANQQISISSPQSASFDLQLTDIAGRSVMQKQISGQQILVRLPVLNTGIYYLSIKSSSGAYGAYTIPYFRG
jgi:hypothetical protein